MLRWLIEHTVCRIVGHKDRVDIEGWLCRRCRHFSPGWAF